MPPTRRAALSYVAFFAAIGAAWPYLPVYYRSLGLGFGAIGLVTAAYSGTQLIGSPIWGGLADRFHRSRLTLPAAALVAAGGALLLAGGGELPGVLAAILILAFGLSGIGPVLDARTIEILGPARIRYGQLRAWGSLSFVVVALGVGLFLDAAGIHALFLVYVPLLVATAAITWSLPRAGAARAGVSVLRGASGIVRSPELGLFLFATFLVFTGLNAVSTFYSIQLVALGGDQLQVGAVWAVGAVIEIPIMYSYHRLAVRFGAGRILVFGSLLFTVRALLSALATEPWMLIAIAPIEGLAYGSYFVAGVDYVSHRAPRGLAATAQGLYTSTGGLAAIVGSLIGGQVAAALSIPWLFVVSGVLGLVGAGVVAVAVRRGASAPAPAEMPATAA